MSNSPPPDDGPRPRSILPTLALIAVAGILAAALFWTPWEQDKILPPSFNIAGRPPRPESIDLSGYLGDASCAECHPGEAAAHSASGHSRTLWPAGEGSFARWLDGQRFKDPEHPDVEFSYHLRGKQLEAERREGGRVERMILEFAVGSGKHGVTPVTFEPPADPATGPSAIEHRFSYLSPTGKMEISPGQESRDAAHLKLNLTPFGRRHSPDGIRDCVACHATLVSRRKLDRLDPETFMPNVSCERCHGPGREHIAAARAGNADDLKMPMKLLTEPAYQVEQCGACHRLPENVDKAGLRPDNPDISRFQSVGVSMSACFKDGMGSFKCSTCHEVHGRTSRDREAYEQACLQCHPSASASSSGQRPCPVEPQGRCIECHMPKVKVPGGWSFTDHWIRKPGQAYGGTPGLPPPAPTRPAAGG